MNSGCSHGKTFKEPCTECQLVLAREGLAWALQSVDKYSKLIADLENGLKHIHDVRCKADER